MPRVLLMDYSTDRTEGPATARWLPVGSDVHTWVMLDGVPVPGLVGFTHVIHTGSALSINDDHPFLEAAMSLVREGVAQGVPQLGICFGHQLLCRALGGRVAVRACPGGPEAGWCEVAFTRLGQRFFGVAARCRVFQHHFDEVVALPAGAVVLASSPHTAVQAFQDPVRRLVGTQFHPEFDPELGNAIFHRQSSLLSTFGLDAAELVLGRPEGFDTAAFLARFVRERSARTWDLGWQ